jgi:hypothetical protein
VDASYLGGYSTIGVAYAASFLGGLLDQRRAVLGGYSTSGSKTDG